MRKELCRVEIQLRILTDITMVLHISQSPHADFTGRVLTHLANITGRAMGAFLLGTTEAEDVRTFLASLQLEIRVYFSNQLQLCAIVQITTRCTRRNLFHIF